MVITISCQVAKSDTAFVQIFAEIPLLIENWGLELKINRIASIAILVSDILVRIK